jgi:hypothetical protein
MGKQYNKVEKSRRRKAYLVRRREREANLKKTSKAK